MTAAFSDADLRDADLRGSDLIAADLRSAKLSGANLRWCDLRMAILADIDLAGADLAKARLSETILANLDLSAVQGLRDVRHEGPSSIGTDTLERTLTAASSDRAGAGLVPGSRLSLSDRAPEGAPGFGNRGRSTG